MEKNKLDYLKKTSDLVIRLYVLYIVAVMNKKFVDMAINNLKTVIDYEGSIISGFTDDEISAYMLDHPFDMFSSDPVEKRVFFRMLSRCLSIEMPALVFDNRHYYDIINARAAVDELKDAYELNRTAKEKNSITKEEFKELEMARLTHMISVTIKAPLVEEFLINCDFDVSKLNRYSLEDFEEKYGLPCMEEFPQDRLFEMLNVLALKILMFKPDKDIYLSSAQLTGTFSNFSSYVKYLDEDHKEKLIAFLDSQKQFQDSQFLNTLKDLIKGKTRIA